MTTVLALLDASAAARPVLEAALRLGELAALPVEAVHVVDGPVQSDETLARRAGVALRLLPRPLDQALLDAVEDPTVAAAVVGARSTPGGRRPVGSNALSLLERTGKPVLVVPPEALSPAPFRRLLVPLEGTASAAQPVVTALLPLVRTEAEFVVLHVFTEDTLPRMLDRPVRDLDLLGDRFLARHLPGAARIELRRGPVAARVAELTAELGADVVVLSWSQDSSPGHAATLRGVLGTSAVPVLVLPVAEPAAPSDDDPGPAG